MKCLPKFKIFNPVYATPYALAKPVSSEQDVRLNRTDNQPNNQSMLFAYQEKEGYIWYHYLWYHYS